MILGVLQEQSSQGASLFRDDDWEDVVGLRGEEARVQSSRTERSIMVS